MKKVVGASATACFMMAALLTGCDNKCGMKLNCDPCPPTGATSASVARVITADDTLPCIAVLPFQCTDDYPQSGIIVADALAESLTAIDGCVVYSPEAVTSRIRFKDGDIIDPVEVGRQLNAPYVLAGRVTEYDMGKESGTASVGVTARLIDSRTGQEVWTAKQYEEYMNGTLGQWTDAVSADLAQAIDLKTPATAVVPVQPPQVIAPPPVAVAPVPVVPPPTAGGSSLADEISFNTDTDPWDFGVPETNEPAAPVAVAPVVPAPVVVSVTAPAPAPIEDEFGIMVDTPLTARYGTPTLPTNKVGQILDQFEDPTPPRYVTPQPKYDPMDSYAVSSVTTDVVPATVPAPVLPEKTGSAIEAPANYYAAQGRTVNGTVDYDQFHYTGANPFADGPGKKVKEKPIDDLISNQFSTVATIEQSYQPAPAEPERTPETKNADMANSALPTSDLYGEFTDFPELPSSLGDFMPDAPSAFSSDFTLEPPVAMGIKADEERPNLYMPSPPEPMALSDIAAMAMPEMPEEEYGKEVMYMPEPLTTEPSSQQSLDVFMPADDGSFKVTISAEQFLEDDAFDFFGSLSTKLGDMDDIEG